MYIIKKHMKPTEFFQEEHQKHQIVLHHTVSSTWQSAWGWWDGQAGHIVTAFIIDKDGTIIETFDPKHWAYHTGTGAQYDKHSIGIELVNEGYLTEGKDGNYYWMDGKYKYKGTPYKLRMPWKGHSHFASYTHEQIQVTKELCESLCEDFKIDKLVTNGFHYDPNYSTQKGIIIHANVKESKTDLSPAFPLLDLQRYLDQPAVIHTPWQPPKKRNWIKKFAKKFL